MDKTARNAKQWRMHHVSWMEPFQKISEQKYFEIIIHSNYVFILKWVPHTWGRQVIVLISLWLSSVNPFEEVYTTNIL